MRNMGGMYGQYRLRQHGENEKLAFCRRPVAMSSFQHGKFLVVGIALEQERPPDGDHFSFFDPRGGKLGVG